MIRRARPEDAESIVALVQATYGDAYVHPALYDPDELRREQAAGTLVSVVAVEGERVVGHYALERPEGHRGAETGMAMVLPDQRGGGLMDAMRTALEDLARELGLEGIWGTPVTLHPYSQKVYDRHGNHPTGLLLGCLDLPVAGFPERRQRHLMLYFQYLQPPPPRELFVPAPWQPIVGEIYAALGAPVTLREPSGEGRGVDEREFLPGVPQLIFPGPAAPSLDRPAGTVYLDLPLEVDGWAGLAHEARRQGFVFAGVLPMRPAGDRLWLQRYRSPFDSVEVAISAPLGRRIWEFIRSDGQPAGMRSSKPSP